MTDMTPEEIALEKYPPKYIAETWIRRDSDVNAPLRKAFLEGFERGYDSGYGDGYDAAGVWKPSKEQMTNLLRAEGRLRIEGECVLASKLAELYEQLKKLM